MMKNIIMKLIFQISTKKLLKKTNKRERKRENIVLG